MGLFGLRLKLINLAVSTKSYSKLWMIRLVMAELKRRTRHEYASSISIIFRATWLRLW